MRLIDADALKKNLAEWLIGGDPQETIMVKLDDVLVSVSMEIDKQPIAYDVEKVVEQLNNAGYDEGLLQEHIVRKIIKDGGVE